MLNALVTGVLSDPHNDKSYKDYLTFLSKVKKSEVKVVSLFTTSCGLRTANGESELVYFLDLVEQMTHDHRFGDCVFVLKLKKPISNNGRSSKLLLDKYTALTNSNRVYDFGMKVSASLIIGISDYVLSMAFTSPTLDALGLRTPAGFVLEEGKLSGSIFSKRRELLNNTIDDVWNNWSYFSSMSEMEFDKYYLDTLPLKCAKNNGEPGYQVIADYLSE
jgi:polysaccharide biosynthesis PFTS motif protein